MSELNSIPGVISFLGYRLVNLSYTCDPSFEIGSPDYDSTYHFAFSKGGALLSDTEYQLNLMVKICYGKTADYPNSPFRLAVEIAGRYECQDGWQQRWETNALAILFPYLRALVSTVTAQSGREPLVLPTVNITQFFRQSAGENAKADLSQVQ